jgi:hypothetical protein
MRKTFFPASLKVLSTAFVCLLAVSSLVRADDAFAIAIGAHDNLVVFGPKGERAAELPVPSLAQPVTAGDASFQVSYGRDFDGRLTAIVAPNATAPTALHFSVMGKSIEADKAVVTLIFSHNLSSVSVRAGYGGNVRVNSRRVSPSLMRP